jgi:glycosyltransferase involved in cell wall biosynthesis
MQTRSGPMVAVVIPCHNEASTIGRVVQGFRDILPEAQIVVADNASTDETGSVAAAAGARVIREPRRGKGLAIQRLFADVEADCYLMVDGDATYDPSSARHMLALVLDHGTDMVNAVRVSKGGEAEAAYRRGHRLGNRILTWIFRQLFNLYLTDTLSGYRALSRRFVKSFPSRMTGFEVEAELNAHAATVGAVVEEVQSYYSARPPGSDSKLSTYRDGFRIMRRNFRLARDARPLSSFALLALPWLIATPLLLVGPVMDYLDTGLVAKFPRLIAGVGTFVVAVQLVVAGIILERVTRNRNEVVRLSYLRIPAATAGRIYHQRGRYWDLGSHS